MKSAESPLRVAGSRNSNGYMENTFEKRIRSPRMARQLLPYRMVDAKEARILWKNLFQTEPVSDERVIYVHVPFCTHICPFCIYTKQIAENKETMTAWSKTLHSQIQSISESRWVQAMPFQALYFGGGTPTALPAKDLTDIIHEIRKKIPLAQDCEITVESTISEITPALCRELKNAGVNRISLGIQTFNNAIRKNLGRVSGIEEIDQTVQVISESHISNICADLIYMLSGQTPETWKTDLKHLSELPFTGCSVYPLITKPGGEKCGLEENIQQERAFFDEADSYFTGKSVNWQRITPVQYGHSIKGTAKYVSSHGQNADLLAFGPGAGGRIKNAMYMQGNSTDEFIRHGSDFFNAPMVTMQIDHRFLGLREMYKLSEGLKMTQKQFSPLKPDFEPLIRELTNAGLVEENGESFCLTAAGRFWAANISALFSRKIKELLVPA